MSTSGYAKTFDEKIHDEGLAEGTGPDGCDAEPLVDVSAPHLSRGKAG